MRSANKHGHLQGTRSQQTQAGSTLRVHGGGSPATPCRCFAGTHVLSILLGFLVLYYPFGNAVAILVPAALGSYALLGLGRQRCVAPTWLACGGYLLLW